MCILSVSAGVLLEDAFSLWVSVSYKNHYIEYLECNQINQGLSDYAGYKMSRIYNFSIFFKHWQEANTAQMFGNHVLLCALLKQIFICRISKRFQNYTPPLVYWFCLTSIVFLSAIRWNWEHFTQNLLKTVEISFL